MSCIPLLCLLLAAQILTAAVNVEEAKAALGRMAGLATLAGQNLVEERGVLTTRIDTPLGAVAVSIMRGPKDSWIAILQPPAEASLDLSTIWPAVASDVVGDGRIRPVAVIVSSAEVEVETRNLPPAVRTMTDGAKTTLKTGGNIFLQAKTGRTGVLAQIRTAIGAGDEPIPLTGPCDGGMVSRLAGGSAPSTTCTLTANFPASTPPMFAGLDGFSLRFLSTRISIGLDGAALQLSGEQRLQLRVLDKTLELADRLAMSKDGNRYRFACSGSLDLSEDLLGTRDAGFDVRKLTLGGDLAAEGGQGMSGFGMQIGAQVQIRGVGPVQGDFAIEIAGKAVREISLSLRTAAGSSIGLGTLPGIKELPGAKQFAFTQLSIGVAPATKEAFLAGDLEWTAKQVRAQAALLLGRSDKGPVVSLFLKADGLTLRKLIPTIPAEMDVVPLDQAMIVISSGSLADRSPAMLPSLVRRMIASIAGRTDGKVTVSDGLTVFTAYTPGGPMAESMAALGMGKDPIILAGSVGGVFSGDPSFALYADLGTLPVPKGGQPAFIKAGSVTPRFFLAARDLASKPSLDAGIAVQSRVRIGNDDLDLGMRTFVTLGRAGAGVRINGTMGGLWTDMLGLQGMDLGNLFMEVGVDADASATLGLAGQLVYDGRSFQCQSRLGVTPVGVPKQLGLSLRADELSPSIMLRMMDTFMRSAVLGPLASTITDKRMKDNLKTVLAGPSLADLAAKELPLDVLQLRGAHVFFATPGASDPNQPDLDGMGIGVAGTLIMDGTIKAGSINAYVTESKGMRISGKIADFDFGLIALKGAMLDVRLPMVGQGLPRFQMEGDARVLAAESRLQIEVSKDRARFVTDNDWGAFGHAKIRAETLGGTLIKPKDAILEVEASADLKNGIRKQLAPAITAQLDAIGKGEEQAIAEAQTQLKDLEAQLATTRTEAGKNKADAGAAISAAQKRVNKLDDQLDDLDDDIDEKRDDIETAKDKLQADKVIKLGIELGALYTRRTAVRASYATAKAVLKETKKVTKAVPIDLYPEVIAAQAEVDAKRSELDALNAAHAVNGEMSRIAKAISDGAKSIPLAIEEVSLKEARLSSAMQGKPQVLRLKVRLERPGKDPLFVDESLRINLMKPAEMDLSPLARLLREALIAAERSNSSGAAGIDEALRDRPRTKPKRKKK